MGGKQIQATSVDSEVEVLTLSTSSRGRKCLLLCIVLSDLNWQISVPCRMCHARIPFRKCRVGIDWRHRQADKNTLRVHLAAFPSGSTPENM